MSALRTAVVGAGHMGAHHMRVYSEMKGVELVAVVDADMDRARRAASVYGGTAHRSVDTILDHVDAASVAVPTPLHAEVAGTLLDAGIHCLVEKPLATTREDCRSLIATARRNGVVLLVGHVERFNPVVQQLTRILRDSAIHAIDVRRLSVSSRGREVDVVTDLMVHDLDVVLSLMGDEVVSVAAQGVWTDGTSGQDLVSAMLGFGRGGLAMLTASRITDTKVREIQLTTDLGFITANYSTQELLVHRRGRVSAVESASDAPSYILDLATERVLIGAAEPLLLELRHFVDAIAAGTPPLVSGEDALRAMELVWQVQAQLSRPAALAARG